MQPRSGTPLGPGRELLLLLAQYTIQVMRRMMSRTGLTIAGLPAPSVTAEASDGSRSAVEAHTEEKESM